MYVFHAQGILTKVKTFNYLIPTSSVSRQKNQTRSIKPEHEALAVDVANRQNTIVPSGIYHNLPG